MTPGSLSGQFIAGPKGQLFVLRRGAATGAPCVIVIPPFAEEMNKTRRMVSMVATRLARHDVTTVVPDLFGTGDSSGDFGDATWKVWLDDIRSVAEWSASNAGPVTGMLAIRTGCSLACSPSVLAALPALERTVFWQPVLDGSRFLTQFLRIRVAASMSSGTKETVRSLRDELAERGSVEVAGYRISASLAADLDALTTPICMPRELGILDWFEVTRAEASPADQRSSALDQASRDRGNAVRAHRIRGEAFWSSTEIVTLDDLVAETARCLLGSYADAREPAT